MIIMGHLLHHISPAFPISKHTPKFSSKFSVDCINNIDKYSTTKPPISWSTNLISVAIAVALVAPLPSHAIPFTPFNPKSSSTTTPFSQAQNLPTGLENGYTFALCLSKSSILILYYVFSPFSVFLAVQSVN